MFYDKFRAICRENGVTPSRVAIEIGINKSSVSNWKTYGTTPKAHILQRIADYFGVSVDYLLGKDTTPDGWVRVLGRVAAGIPIEAIEDVVDMEQLSLDTDHSFEYCGLVIHGDSMEPKMSEGDVVIVRIQPEVEDGDIAIVFVNGTDATCKKIKKTPEGIFLIALNPAYAPQFYSNQEIKDLPIRVFGKVVELRAKF